MTPKRQRDPIPPGTLEMLVLRTLARNGDQHGFEIADSIERVSSEILRVEEGSLYPALQRMLLKGWVTAEWDRTSENRRARYYHLTALGQRQLDREIDDYQRVRDAIARVLGPI